MSKARKFILGGLAAVSFSASIAASTPAEAWYRPYGWYGGGGWGWGGGWGGGWGWGGPAIAAGVLGGLALGSIAAGAAAPYYGYPYPYGYAAYPYAGYPYGGYAYAVPRRVCRVRSPVFDAWGRFAGYRRLRVRC
jgi:hypothetical protein